MSNKCFQHFGIAPIEAGFNFTYDKYDDSTFQAI